jgi:hypothetical protein
MNHTPGSWLASPNGRAVLGPEYHHPNHPEWVPATLVCQLSNSAFGSYRYYPEDQVQANAKLIAAAPELLEELEAMADWMEDQGYECEHARQLIKQAIE